MIFLALQQPLNLNLQGESSVFPCVEHIPEFRRHTRQGKQQAQSELEGVWEAVADGGVGQRVNMGAERVLKRPGRPILCGKKGEPGGWEHLPQACQDVGEGGKNSIPGK